MKTSIYFRIITIWLIILAPPLHAVPDSNETDKVGTAILATGNVTAQSAISRMRILKKGAPIYRLDKIKTSYNSFIVIRMNDGGKLTLRPRSEIKISEYNDTRGQEKEIIELITGGLRTVTGLIGKLRPEAVSYKNKTTTIGIRGTTFSLRLCEQQECENKIAQENNQQKHNQNRPDIIRTNRDGSQNIIERIEQQNGNNGLYVWVIEGKVSLIEKDWEVDLGAGEQCLSGGGAINCFNAPLNFQVSDPYLNGAIEKRAPDTIRNKRSIPLNKQNQSNNQTNPNQPAKPDNKPAPLKPADKNSNWNVHKPNERNNNPNNNNVPPPSPIIERDTERNRAPNIDPNINDQQNQTIRPDLPVGFIPPEPNPNENNFNAPQVNSPPPPVTIPIGGDIPDPIGLPQPELPKNPDNQQNIGTQTVRPANLDDGNEPSNNPIPQANNPDINGPNINLPNPDVPRVDLPDVRVPQINPQNTRIPNPDGTTAPPPENIAPDGSLLPPPDNNIPPPPEDGAPPPPPGDDPPPPPPPPPP